MIIHEATSAIRNKWVCSLALSSDRLRDDASLLKDVLKRYGELH